MTLNMNTLALATQLWCGFVTLGARGEIMNNPSYETFIRICQGCLININGTSPHFSNHSRCSPSPPLCLLLLLQNPLLPITISPPFMLQVYLFSPFSVLSHFILSSFYPLTLMISTTLNSNAVPMKSRSYLLSSIPSSL